MVVVAVVVLGDDVDDDGLVVETTGSGGLWIWFWCGIACSEYPPQRPLPRKFSYLCRNSCFRSIMSFEKESSSSSLLLLSSMLLLSLPSVSFPSLCSSPCVRGRSKIIP